MAQRDDAVGPIVVLGLGGSLRQPSQSERALRVALAGAAAAGATTEIITGRDLDLPFYASSTPAHEGVRRLLAAARRADGLILASPAYHGTISGVVKNALDYMQDLMDDDPPYLDGKAVGVLSTGMGTQAAVQTIDALRHVVHALRAWPTPLAVAIHDANSVYRDGEVVDAATIERLHTMGAQVVEFAHARRLLAGRQERDAVVVMP